MVNFCLVPISISYTLVVFLLNGLFAYMVNFSRTKLSEPAMQKCCTKSCEIVMFEWRKQAMNYYA